MSTEAIVCAPAQDVGTLWQLYDCSMYYTDIFNNNIGGPLSRETQGRDRIEAA